ncbi:hypothetical protein L9F63_000428, partial [Diploptera punctata]
NNSSVLNIYILNLGIFNIMSIDNSLSPLSAFIITFDLVPVILNNVMQHYEKRMLLLALAIADVGISRINVMN